MEPEGGIDLRIVEHAFVDHHQRATATLFSGLEEQLDRSRELIPAIHQQSRHPEQPRGVGIVSAGVHLARYERLVLDLVLFLDRKRIHIGTEEHDPLRPWFGAADEPGDTGDGYPGANILDAEGAETLGDELGGFELLEAELRMLVDVAAIGDDAWQDLLDIAPKFHDGGNQSSAPVL
jgi:hypothetical protein